MKFTALKENLKEGVLLIEKSTGKKTALPVLSTILCAAEKGKITLTATNLETAVEVWVGGKIEQEGKIAIPARVLSSYISLVKDEHLTCLEKGGNFEIISPMGRTVIHGQQADDFPIIPKQNKTTAFTFSAVSLRNALQNTVIAAAISDIKPEIASVFVSLLPAKAVFAATDSFRLAEQCVEGVFGEKGWSQSFLLPAKSAYELIRFLENETDTVAVFFGEGQIVFQTKRFRMVSRLTEGVFPDYKRIIPTMFSTECIIPKDVFIEMLRLTGVFVSKLQEILLQVNPATQHIEMYARNTDIGEHVVKRDIKGTGKEIRINFNYHYLMDGLQHLSGDVHFGFVSSEGPLLMRAQQDPSYFYIVMPMKI